MFHLGRLDVWPTGDLGVRNGYGKAWGLAGHADAEGDSSRWATGSVRIGRSWRGIAGPRWKSPHRRAGRISMRIATWNVNSLNVRMPRIEEWFAYAQPDVVCMQETKLADAAFPYMTFEAMGYEVAHNGTGRWNGVAIASRVGLDDVTLGFGDGRHAVVRGRRTRAAARDVQPVAGCACRRCTCRTGGPSTTRTTSTSCGGSPRCATRSRATSTPSDNVVVVR